MQTRYLLIEAVAVDFTVVIAHFETVAVVEATDGANTDYLRVVVPGGTNGAPPVAVTGLVDTVVVKYVVVLLVGTDTGVVKFDKGNALINISVQGELHTQLIGPTRWQSAGLVFADCL